MLSDAQIDRKDIHVPILGVSNHRRMIYAITCSFYGMGIGNGLLLTQSLSDLRESRNNAQTFQRWVNI